MLEIERKFLPKLTIPEMVSAGDLTTLREPNEIIQGYLKVGKEEEIRVSHRGYLTQKRGSGLVREENIYEIGIPAFEVLLPLCNGRVVNKVRHYYNMPEHPGLVLEVDLYKGAYQGLVTAEIEFYGDNAEQEAKDFAIPSWLGEEVTGVRKYQNSYIAENAKPISELPVFPPNILVREAYLC